MLATSSRPEARRISCLMRKVIVKRRSNVLGIFLCILAITGCRAGALHQASIGANEAPAPEVSCVAGPGALSTAAVPMSQVEPSLTYLQNFQPETYALDRPRATKFLGPCGSSVTAMILDKVGLSDGNVYQITSSGLEPWPVAYSQMFDHTTLNTSDIPDIPDAQFVHAVPIEPPSARTGVGTRYLGLWKQNSGGLVVDFTLTAGGGKHVKVRPLLRSDLPLRSISYFPSPDTRSGGLYLVQEATPGEVRAISFSWWHKK